jgi:two-component system, NarL family, nitrate/nitrite response regulator NarL
MIQVLIVDDHKIFGQGLGELLRADEEIEVTDILQDEKQVLRSLKNKPADIVMLDFQLKSMDGIDVTRIILKSYPDMKIIILSMIKNARFFHQLMEEGIKGYLTKNSGKEEIIRAIHAVHEGNTYFGQDIMSEYLSNKVQVFEDSVHYKLTNREKSIIRLLIQGMTTSQICEKLGLAENSVKTYRKNLLSKFGVKNSLELVNIALKLKLV